MCNGLFCINLVLIITEKYFLIYELNLLRQVTSITGLF